MYKLLVSKSHPDFLGMTFLLVLNPFMTHHSLLLKPIAPFIKLGQNP
jgi:hypothetical protein